MEASVPEARPFKTLDELYEKLDKLEAWPFIIGLRESTEYVFPGSEINSHLLQMKKVNKDECPKTLVCHDMKGGYLEDRFIDGSKSHDSYLFYHWSIVDTFVYFSHHFITVPPYGWINAAHSHGVKVLGTVITERAGIWEPILESQENVRKFADTLIFVAKFYKFEGWLLNVENEIRAEDVNNLVYFVKYLTERIHEEIDGSEIIWYDSVINDGKLKWQNELNESNKDFFLNCDGIYLNYNWTESRLLNSDILAKQNNRAAHDIYVGLDVWGRGCPGGGGFNSAYKIRERGLSVAIFAPGWTHEYFGPGSFQELEDLFWAQLFPYLYVHVPIYENEVFKTSFCRGSGVSYYRYGEVYSDVQAEDGSAVQETSFYNLTMQKPQISVPTPHLKFIHLTLPSESEEKKDDRNETPKKLKEYLFETKKDIIRISGNIVNFENKLTVPDDNCFEFCSSFSYEGGGCLKLVTKNRKSYHRLFLIHAELQQDVQVTIVYHDAENGTNENEVPNEPILILANNTALKSIIHRKSETLSPKWSRCVYRTDMRTVQEIGVSFTRAGVCYLGQIVLEKEQRHAGESVVQVACIP